MPPMPETPPSDPFAFFRKWVGEWETQVNTHGAEWLKKPEVAQAMQQLSSARLAAQATTDEAAGKLLAAANLPSRADIEALGARLGQIETTLARIEAHLSGTAASAKRPAPKRTRKPGS